MLSNEQYPTGSKKEQLIAHLYKSISELQNVK
jgi:hypothetical protein